MLTLRQVGRQGGLGQTWRVVFGKPRWSGPSEQEWSMALRRQADKDLREAACGSLVTGGPSQKSQWRPWSPAKET